MRIERHILDLSIAPARVPPEIEREAIGITRAVLEQLEVVGVLCVEFFLTRDGRLLINETGPASPQLRPPHLRRLRHQPVRAAAAGRLRACPSARPSCSVRRRWPTCSVISGSMASRTGHAACALTGGQAPPLRQAGTQGWPQDGPPHRHRPGTSMRPPRSSSPARRSLQP
jgi:hypothetical protein